MTFTYRYIFVVVVICATLGGLFWLIAERNRALVEIPLDTRLHVSASFYPLYFFTEQIGGGKVHVTNMTPTGSEPHDYEPTTQNIVQMRNSNILVLNGGGFEAWGEKVLKNIDTQKTLVVMANENIATQMMHEEGVTVPDPHTWLSPVLAKQIVEKIKQGFVMTDPANALSYEENAQRLMAKLDVLDTEYQQGLAVCSSKNFITAHSAFGYLASTYGLQQVSIAGLSPDAEPSPKQLGDIVQFAKANNVKFIFFESLISPKLSEATAREIGAQTLVLNPVEGLTPDEIARGEDYFTVMRSNLANLRTALGCNAN